MPFDNKLLLLLSAMMCSFPAHAEEQKPKDDFRHFAVRAGYARLNFNEKARVSAAGQPIAGADAILKDNNGFEFDIAYYFNPNVSVALALGAPPTTTLTAAGTLAGTGQLGRVTYGPAVATARHHVTGLGPVAPYVGAGVNYTMILDTDDGALQKFKVKDAFGPVLNGGFDIALDDTFGIYVDVKKIWANTKAEFLLPTPAGPAPGTAKVQLNPVIFNAGVSVRF